MLLYSHNTPEFLSYLASTKTREEILEDQEYCYLLENEYIKDDMELALHWQDSKIGGYEEKRNFIEYLQCNGPELDPTTIIYYREKILNDPELNHIASELTDVAEIREIRETKYNKPTSRTTNNCLTDPCNYLGPFSASMGLLGYDNNSRTLMNVIKTKWEKVKDDKSSTLDKNSPIYGSIPEQTINSIPPSILENYRLWCTNNQSSLEDWLDDAKKSWIFDEITCPGDDTLIGRMEDVRATIMLNMYSNLGDCCRLYEQAHRFNMYDMTKNSKSSINKAIGGKTPMGYKEIALFPGLLGENIATAKEVIEPLSQGSTQADIYNNGNIVSQADFNYYLNSVKMKITVYGSVVYQYSGANEKLKNKYLWMYDDTTDSGSKMGRTAVASRTFKTGGDTLVMLPYPGDYFQASIGGVNKQTPNGQLYICAAIHSSCDPVKSQITQFHPKLAPKINENIKKIFTAGLLKAKLYIANKAYTILVVDSYLGSLSTDRFDVTAQFFTIPEVRKVLSIAGVTEDWVVPSSFGKFNDSGTFDNFNVNQISNMYSNRVTDTKIQQFKGFNENRVSQQVRFYVDEKDKEEAIQILNLSQEEANEFKNFFTSNLKPNNGSDVISSTGKAILSKNEIINVALCVGHSAKDSSGNYINDPKRANPVETNFYTKPLEGTSNVLIDQIKTQIEALGKESGINYNVQKFDGYASQEIRANNSHVSVNLHLNAPSSNEDANKYKGCCILTDMTNFESKSFARSISSSLFDNFSSLVPFQGESGIIYGTTHPKGSDGNPIFAGKGVTSTFDGRGQSFVTVKNGNNQEIPAVIIEPCVYNNESDMKNLLNLSINGENNITFSKALAIGIHGYCSSLIQDVVNAEPITNAPDGIFN